MTHRIERVNELMRREISDILQRHVKDPRLTEFVAVTEVRVSPDLRAAKVFVSSIECKEERQKTLDALAAASGFLRRELAKNLRLRRIPELNFVWDDSIERGDRLTRLIDEVCSPQEQ